MDDPSAETIDRMGLAAFPAFVTEDRGNVVFRAAGGFNYRNSSVTVFDPGAADGHALLAETLAFCEVNGIRPVLRVLGSPGALEPVLQGAGWAPFRDCLVMTRTGNGGGWPEGLRDCDMADWLDIQVRHKGLEGREAKLFREIFAAMPDGARPVAMANGDPQATAMLYAEGGWLGLMNMLVASEARGRGIGRRMLGLLLDVPADGMWLQVWEGNAAAVSLYESAGFTTFYRYAYWAPDA